MVSQRRHTAVKPARALTPAPLPAPPSPPPGEGREEEAGPTGLARHPEGEGRAGRVWAEERADLPDPSARPARQEDSSVAFLPCPGEGAGGAGRGAGVRAKKE